MKKFAVIGLIGALAGCGGAADGTTSPNPGPTVSATAKEISAAFQENEAKAKLTYEGKNLLVTGVVKDIDLSIGDTPVIRLKGSGDQYNMGVNADGKMTDVNISGLTKEQAAEISKGKTMAFACSGIDEVMGSAQLSDCSVAKEQPAAEKAKK